MINIKKENIVMKNNKTHKLVGFKAVKTGTVGKRTLARIACITLCICMAVCMLSVRIFAEGASAGGNSKDVYGKVVDNRGWSTVAADAQGNGAVTLSDGTEITFSGADASKGRLAIDAITEDEALEWIKSAVGGRLKEDIRPFYLLYISNDNSVQAASGVSVAIKLKDAPSDVVAYSLSTDALTAEVSAESTDKGLSFTVGNSPYYVLGELREPTIIDGNGQSVAVGEEKQLSFRSDAVFADFIRVEMDGVTLDASNYTVEEGSTIVTLKPEYVATLSEGEHTIDIVSKSGSAKTVFTVSSEQSAADGSTADGSTTLDGASTDDESNTWVIWVILAVAVVAVAAVAVVLVWLKKKKAQQ